MKKLLLSLFAILLLSNVQSQVTVQATMKRALTPNTVEIYLKPSASFSQKDEAMLFALALPETAKPAPTTGSAGVTPNSNGAVSNINGVYPTFLVNNFGATQREVVVSKENINGEPHFVFIFIFAGTAATNRDWQAGVDQHMFSVQFTGCEVNCMSSVKLVSLPTGGVTQQAWFYFQPNTLGDVTNYASPFYPNIDAIKTINGGSSDGTALSMIEIADVVLPVRLLSFEAAEKNCMVTLEWKVVEDASFTAYIIERSVDGTQFYELGRQNKSTDNNPTKSYHFNDLKPTAGVQYYRLKLTATDGSFTYTAVKAVTVRCGNPNLVLVYPTLSYGFINVKLPAGYAGAQIRILNGVGTTVIVDAGSSLNRTINLKKLPGGSYVAQVIIDKKVIDNTKFILQR